MYCSWIMVLYPYLFAFFRYDQYNFVYLLVMAKILRLKYSNLIFLNLKNCVDKNKIVIIDEKWKDNSSLKVLSIQRIINFFSLLLLRYWPDKTFDVIVPFRCRVFVVAGRIETVWVWYTWFLRACCSKNAKQNVAGDAHIVVILLAER